MAFNSATPWVKPLGGDFNWKLLIELGGGVGNKEVMLPHELFADESCMCIIEIFVSHYASFRFASLI